MSETSLINKENSSGLQIELCSTPNCTGKSSNKMSLRTTDFNLKDKYELIKELGSAVKTKS